MPDIERLPIWETFCKALGAEKREHARIVGASGIEHSVEALAVDEAGKRILLISAEPSPRVAAMMQSDIQATMPDIRVLLARPLAFNFGNLVQVAAAQFGRTRFSFDDMEEWNNRTQSDAGDYKADFEKRLGQVIDPAMRSLVTAGLPFLGQAAGLLQQLSAIDWPSITDVDKKSIDVSSMLSDDALAQDRRYGVCAIPLYEFTEDDFLLFRDPGNHGDASERLRELGIYQYFFPSPDQLALGLVDRGVKGSGLLNEVVRSADALGHPLGQSELVNVRELPFILDALQESGFLVEGEHGIEVTEAGQTQRTTIKFRPREGLVSKLLGRISLGISLTGRDLTG